MSADPSSSVRFGGEVSPAPLASPQVNVNLECLRRRFLFFLFISRIFVEVAANHMQAQFPVFYAQLRFGASADLLRKYSR